MLFNILIFKKYLTILQPSSEKVLSSQDETFQIKTWYSYNHTLEYLEKKHAIYFMNNKIPEKIILRQLNLIGKIQNKVINYQTKFKYKYYLTKTNINIFYKTYQFLTQASTNISKTQILKIMKYLEKIYIIRLCVLEYYDKEQEKENEECYEQNSEMDSENEITDQQYRILYSQIGYNNQLNLNKMTPREQKKINQLWNQFDSGDKDYKYDEQKDYKHSAQNQLDMDDKERL
ncbi:unnamed protein product [Paramecium sonneborni]|uniref:Uncharacterized protein n=1 Tax=Paramecium sonneborni TaxID=65129 RepID=A0A8S1RBQ8_9CILI|nr:unnamed protein product [Paramecium sonneborni]